VLDVVALGIIIPVLPPLIESFVGSTARAGWINGVFVALWAGMQFLFSPLMGALSGRFGRRRVILLSNTGLGLDYLLMAFAPNLWWLAVGRIVSGITSASISTAFAYIADVTAPEKRAQAFGLIGASFGLGFILGPALGGVLGDIDLRLPFLAAGVLSLLNAAYSFFVLPESLKPEHRAPFSVAKANPLGALTLLASNRGLLRLAMVNLLSQCAHYVLPAVFALYALHRYGWSPADVGWVLAGVGICAAFVQGFLTGVVVKRFGERTTLLAGLLFGALGLAVYGLAPTGWAFWTGVPLMSLWGLAGPSIQSLMTRFVSPSEQGRLQGANMSLGSLVGTVAPIVYGGAFALGVGTLGLPGAAFFLAAGLQVAAAALAWRASRKVPAAGEGAPAAV